MPGFFNFLLDLLFPRSHIASELDSMNVEDFVLRASKNAAPVGKDSMALFAYGDPIVREAIWQLKYRGNKKVAALLAHCLYDELLGFLEEYAPLTNFTEPLLVPIPLSRKRESERGFNQCRLLCDELMRLDISLNKGSTAVFGGEGCHGRNFTLSLNALTKTKDTQSQTKTGNKKERLKNLEGCFAASAEVSGRNIILIDDVTTTGATLEEARRALRQACARKVIAFTVAH